MKVRKGFVSNSSSSSFIIAVPKGMEMTAENLHRHLWGTDETLTFGPEYSSTVPVSSREAVDSILSQINCEDGEVYGSKTGKVNDRLIEVIEPDYDYHLMDQFEDADGKIDWDKYREELARRTEIAVDEFLKKFPDCDFYQVEYSDNSGPFSCEMEHGAALDQPSVTRFSHH